MPAHHEIRLAVVLLGFVLGEIRCHHKLLEIVNGGVVHKVQHGLVHIHQRQHNRAHLLAFHFLRYRENTVVDNLGSELKTERGVIPGEL